MYDVQNSHLTAAITPNERGEDDRDNETCQSYDGMICDKIAKYSKARGLPWCRGSNGFIAPRRLGGLG